MVPKRFLMGVMLFLATVTAAVTRVNFSIALVAMVENTDVNSTKILPDYGTRYRWSQADQGYLLGAYFYGYIVTSLPGGTLAENYGGKAVAGWSNVIASILTMLTPPVAAMGKWIVLLDRFAIGLAGGLIFPSCHNLISKWAPPDEKGKFVAALMGITIGAVITWPATGLLIELFDWDIAMYIIGVFIMLLSALWLYLVVDSPAQHKSITEEERVYIENSMRGLGKGKRVKKLPPYTQLLTSVPFLAVLILHFGNLWGLFFLVTAAPKFLSEALNFKLRDAGFLSSLPLLARGLSAFGFAAINDLITKKAWLNVTNTRKLFCITSHVVPGLLLIALAEFGKDPYVCVAFMTFSLGFNGSAVASNLQNAQDLAPNYAGTLYGIMNFFGSASGFLSPMVVAHFAKEKSNVDSWYYVFVIGGVIYILPAFVFWAIGTGDVQPWNEMVEEVERKSLKVEQKKA